MQPVNPFLRAARQRKVSRLLAAIDARVRADGFDPHTQATTIAALIEAANDKDWLQFVRAAGYESASPDTRRELVNAYTARARDLETARLVSRMG